MARCLLLLQMVILLTFPALAGESVLRYASPEANLDYRQEYFLQLLTLVLERTEQESGPVKLLATPDSMQQGRALKELMNGRNIDIAWTVTSSTREQQLLPIRIPLLKGLLGYRVLVIRQQDRDKFSQVTDLATLSNFTAGQGHDWPDTEILRSNNLPVVTSSTYEGLFNMLNSQRFDYFPRGANEAWLEIGYHQKFDLIIEENLLIYYPSPIYFFVHNHNIPLANRIKKGLEIALADGSFERLFTNFAAHQRMFNLINFSQRTIIRLKNPLLPALTPVDNPKYWFIPQ